MSNTFGKNIQVQIFGESHGPAIGVVLEQVPSGILLDEGEIAREMARRAPGKSAAQRTIKPLQIFSQGSFRNTFNQ